MSIYDCSIEQLTTDDIAALLAEGAVENVRLEFKREDPDKDEWLKKLSSLANTYGGYLVLGAEADRNGQLRGKDRGQALTEDKLL
jgi:predicted HTH transcriptional regulator